MEPLVQCPHCLQWTEVTVEPEDRGTVIQDCDVCCRPLEILIRRTRKGTVRLAVVGRG